MAESSRALGAEVIEFPTIEIRPAADYGPLDRAIAAPGRLRLADLHQRQRRALLPGAPGPLRPRTCARCARSICAIGPATRAAVEALHLKVDLMGSGVRGRGPAGGLRARTTWRASACCCRARPWRATWCPSELGRRGAQVDVVEAYRTVVPEGARARAAEIFGARASRTGSRSPVPRPSQNFVEAAGADGARRA